MTPKIVDKELKKIEIISAALKVFSRNGIDKSKMSDVAKEANIGKGTIYEYFRSKDEIFTEAFQLMMREISAKTAPLIKTNIDPFIKLKNLFDIFINYYTDEKLDFAEIMFEFWAEGIRRHDEEIHNKIDINAIYTEYRTLFKEILDDGIRRGLFRNIDSFAIASAIVGVMDGLLLQWIMNRNIFDLKSALYKFVDMLLNGIRK
ncbi:MAG: TetR/AcrR family transcriptional regulator [Calditrichaceae bacterium]|nr:TetR/AcrR family transcriptional regulator [Calditrichaceae bacterium]MBN2707615.1 TetR/AcrR family transcriptional regulator [Calditrichaceae bacterium]RQV93210.1 MAG: TetR/AcrR family transcriptional regulator [Calditrichota bacterium]